MTLIKLSNYCVPRERGGRGSGIYDLDLEIKPGEVLMIVTDSQNDAHLLFKSLATLSYPVRGTYVFNKHKLDFSDYRNLLGSKKQIGYLATGTALISNRSLRENLCQGQVYFDNDMSMTLTEETMELCRDFGIDPILEERPTKLGNIDVKLAMIVRELAKKPMLMLAEFPEHFSGPRFKYQLMHVFKQRIESGMALVYVTYDDEIIKAFKGRVLRIKNGKAEVLRISRNGNG